MKGITIHETAGDFHGVIEEQIRGCYFMIRYWFFAFFGSLKPDQV